MKLAIDRTSCKGQIVTDAAAAALTETHRVVDVILDGSSEAGQHFVDIWGGTWFVPNSGETLCTVGSMDKWS